MCTRYPQGGGLTAEGRAFRERLRIRAAGRFATGEDTAAIAKDLRVSVRSVQRCRRAWSEPGPQALRLKGPASLPLLSDGLFVAPGQESARRAVAHG